MSIAIRSLFEPMRTVAFGSITTGYTAVGTPFTHPARQIYIQNTTNGLLSFSIDGVDDHFVVAGNGFLIVDTTSNKTIDQGFFFSRGTQIYVKYITAPSSGTLYISIINAFERR